MKSHEDIDRRSLELAREVVRLIDADPCRRGVELARANCARWLANGPAPAVSEWQAILAGDWGSIRLILLDEGQEGRRLRQSNPFCGILSPRQRWEVYRRFRHESEAA